MSTQNADGSPVARPNARAWVLTTHYPLRLRIAKAWYLLTKQPFQTDVWTGGNPPDSADARDHEVTS